MNGFTWSSRETIEKNLAVLLIQLCTQVGLRVKEASALAGDLVGKTECTMRDWQQNFFHNEMH